MTVGPRRLRDDPDFKWETGCDLADEQFALPTPDLAGGRSRLLASVALLGSPTVGDGVPNVRPGRPWSAAAKPVAGLIAAAMVVAGAYWLGLQAGVPVALPVAPSAETAGAPGRPDVGVPVAPSNVDAVIAVPGGPPAAAPAMPAASPAEPAPVPAEPGPVAVRQPPRAPAVTEPVVVPIAAEPAAPVPAESPSMIATTAPVLLAPANLSGLPAQLAVFEPASDALAGGHFAVARAGFEEYLARWPAGGLANEARLGQLRALSGVGDAAETSRLAAALQDDPAFSGRRSSIVALRVQALITLGQCDEALEWVDQLGAGDAAEAKKACRNLRRVEH